MKEYFVNAPLIIWANDRDEAGSIAREKLDRCGFEYGLMGHGTEIRRFKVVIAGVHSSTVKETEQ